MSNAKYSEIGAGQVPYGVQLEITENNLVGNFMVSDISSLLVASD